mmetsp:Transcript_8637/g.13650  ORF Transcript_8637/g.13650 Transcript_8637/m.13650 type:complete len:82 (-) Transcript_8637:3-248(-)
MSEAVCNAAEYSAMIAGQQHPVRLVVGRFVAIVGQRTTIRRIDAWNAQLSRKSVQNAETFHIVLPAANTVANPRGSSAKVA